MASSEYKRLSEAVDAKRDELQAAKRALSDWVVAQAPYAVGDIISFMQRGKRAEGRVVRVEPFVGERAHPIVIQRKANGEWGIREVHIYNDDKVEVVSKAEAA